VEREERFFVYLRETSESERKRKKKEKIKYSIVIREIKAREKRDSLFLLKK